MADRDVRASLAQKAADDVRRARTVAELRTAQAMVLTGLLGVSASQAAVVIGRDRGWVSRARSSYLHGPDQLAGGGRGGRRNQLFEADEELELVKGALVQLSSSAIGTTLRSTLRSIVDAELGYVVPESTLSGILRRCAPQLLPGGSVWELDQYSHLLAQIIKAESRLRELRRR